MKTKTQKRIEALARIVEKRGDDFYAMPTSVQICVNDTLCKLGSDQLLHMHPVVRKWWYRAHGTDEANRS